MATDTLQQEARITPDTLFKGRLDFAERCLANAQDLSRFMDLKANYVLSAVALMTAAVGIVASKALDANPTETWRIAVKLIAMLFFAGYAVVAFLVIYNATQVFRALPSMLVRKTANVPGLIFPLAIINKYQGNEGLDDELYFHKLVNVTPEEMFRDYSNQIVEVSNIYARKQAQINKSLGFFRWLTIYWVVAILLLLVTILLK
jgi:hypothetical protein